MFKNKIKILEALDAHLEKSYAPIKTFCIFGMINYPLFFLFWNYSHLYINSDFCMRAVAGLLCLIIFLKSKWPKRLHRYFSLFWYLSILYCLPFFGTFSFLSNKASIVWLTNAMLGLFWLILITDWLSFALLLTIGIPLALIIFIFLHHHIEIQTPHLFSTLTNYSWTIVITVIFSYGREKFFKEKIDTMRALGASIGHELRRPLTTILTSSKALSEMLPKLIENYEHIITPDINIHKIRPSQLKAIIIATENIKSEMYLANSLIDMLLLKVDQIKPKFGEPEELSIEKSITNAIARYPYPSEEHRQRVHFDCAHAFNFLGREILIEHVIFNLLKNSLHAIDTINKGEIYISTAVDDNYHYLFFKDTATGIAPQHQQFLFSRFFSTTRHGTGLGLAFCKLVMEYYGGRISCHSIYTEFTEFKLIFPKIKVYDLQQQGTLAIC